MKKFKNINFLLIVLLLLLIIFNCFNNKIIENVENSCPTKEEVKRLQENNDVLSKKVKDQDNTIQEAKMKNFCKVTQKKCNELNEKVNSMIKKLNQKKENKK